MTMTSKRNSRNRTAQTKLNLSPIKISCSPQASSLQRKEQLFSTEKANIQHRSINCLLDRVFDSSCSRFAHQNTVTYSVISPSQRCVYGRCLFTSMHRLLYRYLYYAAHIVLIENIHSHLQASIYLTGNVVRISSLHSNRRSTVCQSLGQVLCRWHGRRRRPNGR